MKAINRYTSEEILARLKTNYLQQQKFDPEVEGYQELTFHITVRTWRDICDLPEPYQLADYFNHLFELNISVEKWILVLQPEKTKNLKEICEFISGNAIKPFSQAG